MKPDHLITLTRSADGVTRIKRQHRYHSIAELNKPDMAKAWRGIQRHLPAYADMLKTDPIMREVIEKYGGMPQITHEEFTKIMQDET